MRRVGEEVATAGMALGITGRQEIPGARVVAVADAVDAVVAIVAGVVHVIAVVSFITERVKVVLDPDSDGVDLEV